jgi:predicted PurR-regulated permease PerM
MAKGTSKKTESGGEREWESLHLWQIQPVRDVLLVLAIVGVLWFGYLISVVTVPLLLALLLAYLFEPLVARMERVRWISRQGAAAAIIAGTIALVVVPVAIGVSFAVVQGVGYASRFAKNTEKFVAAVNAPDDESLRGDLPPSWKSLTEYVIEVRAEDKRRADEAENKDQPGSTPDDAPQGDAESPSPDDDASSEGRSLQQSVEEASSGFVSAILWVANWVEANADSLGRQALMTGRDALRFAISTFTSLGVLAFSGFLTAFFFFFFSTGFAHVVDFWKDLLPKKNKDNIIELVGKMDKVIAAFVRGRLTIALLQSIVFSIAYWLIGVPAPLLLGIGVAVLSIVPYLALVGVPISIFLLWLEPSSVAWQQEWWWVLGAPLGVYFGVQALDDYLWTPMIQGKGTGMDTPSIVAASVAGGALAGVYGLLIAIPVAACGKIVIRELVWPRIVAWREGEAKDPLPIGKSE